MSTKSRSSGYLVFLIPGIVASVAVIVVPLVMTVGISFTRWTGIGDPEWIGFDNYTRLFHDEQFWASFGHILLLILAMAVVPTLLGLLLAAVLFDYVGKVFGDRWAGFFRSGLYLPQVLPVAVTGIVWGWILHPEYGALNRILGSIGLSSLERNWLGDPKYALYSVMAVMIWFQLGYPIVMFMSGLQRIDPELYEAADLDGATEWQKLRRVTLPIIKPTAIIITLLALINAMHVFGLVVTLTGGGPVDSTNVVSLFIYNEAFANPFGPQYGYASAAALFFAVLAAVFVGGYRLFGRKAERIREDYTS
jgi:raffinose/stachyose/melibiose transport system permease protein